MTEFMAFVQQKRTKAAAKQQKHSPSHQSASWIVDQAHAQVSPNLWLQWCYCQHAKLNTDKSHIL